MDERLSVIKQAMQLEDDGRQYYLQAAARARNPLAKNTFQWLAEQEQQHKQYFVAYYQIMEEQHDWPPMSKIGVSPQDARQEAARIFQQALAQIEEAVPADIGLSELYDGAMELERKSIDLYRTEAERATEHNAREFYEFLTEEERGHLNLLATTLEYLDHPDSWYLTEEQWIVEG